MLTFSWDSSYESNPGSGLSRGSIDDVLRQMSRGIRERMEREHNFGYNSEKDDGTHRPGKTSVALRDNTATRDALSNVQEGAFYVGTDNHVYVYEPGTGWVDYSDIDHGNLENLDGTGHDEVYWRETDDLSNIDATLDMGGNVLTVTDNSSGVLRVSDHIFEKHTLDSISAIKDGELTTNKLGDTANVHILTYSGTTTLVGIGPLQFNLVSLVLPDNVIGILGINVDCSATTRFGCFVKGGEASKHISIIANSEEPEPFEATIRAAREYL